MAKKVKEGAPPETRELIGEAGAEAVKVFAQRAEPVVDELRHEAEVGIGEAALLCAAGAFGFLALELATAGAVELSGRKIGRANAALVAAALAAGGAGALVWIAARGQVRAPGRRILERLVATLRSMTRA